MKHVKSTITVFTVLLLVFQIVFAVAAESSIEHPQVKVFGDVQKTVYEGRSIFEYKDDQGLSSVLPFERQEKQNITINFANIVFSENFENKSIASATVTKPNEMSVTSDVLTSNELEYIYLKETNSSALATNTYYDAKWTLSISDEPAITNDYYLFFTAKNKKTGTNIAIWGIYVKFIFKDSGATTRYILVDIKGSSGTSGVTSDETTVYYIQYGKDNTYFTLQLKIKDLLDKANKSWSLVKLTGIEYVLSIKTGTTLDESSTLEGWINHAFVTTSKVYIDDPQYENSELIVNGTSGKFTAGAGDVINVYGANCTKIMSVTIPWQVEVTPTIDKDPDNLRMQYTWEWTMPKSPTGVGDTLTFSNTHMTLYGYKDGDAWDKLYLNGVDKLSSIASKKVPTTTGSLPYWTYGLASSLTEGNMYQAIARVQYTSEEYDSLTDVPLFFENPIAWIQYKFWSVIIAVCSFLGLSSAWAMKQRRKAQIAKVK